MASHFLLTFPQIISIISFTDFEVVKNYNPNTSVLETPEFKKKTEETEWLKESAEVFRGILACLDLVKHLNNHTQISYNLCLKGIGALEASLSGENLQEFLHFLVKA